jgi:PST family polysaccharide transporter
VFGTTVLSTFSSRIDQLVIGRFAGAATLGQYVVGLRLAELARGAIQTPVEAISMPALAKVRNDYERLREGLYKGMELNAIVCFAVFGGLASIAPTIVPLVFGSQWRAAASILPLVAIYSLTGALSVFFYPALLASGGLGRYVFVNVACALGSAMACLIGIRFGVHMLIVLLTINMIGTGVLTLLFLQERIHLSLRRFCLPGLVPALAGTVMFAAVTLIRSVVEPLPSAWLRAALEVIGGATAYVAVVLTLAWDSSLRLWQMADAVFTRRRLPPVPTIRESVL